MSANGLHQVISLRDIFISPHEDMYVDAPPVTDDKNKKTRDYKPWLTECVCLRQILYH